MAVIHERFTEALRTRLNGKYQSLREEAGSLSPERARGARVPSEIIAQANAEVLGIQYCKDLGDFSVSSDFISTVPIAFARQHRLIGLAGVNGQMLVAIADLKQSSQLQTLSKILQKRITPLLAPGEQITRAINAAYQQQSGQAQRFIEELDGEQLMQELRQVADNEDLLDVASRAPVIKLVHLMLFEAVKRRASDVHVQPLQDRLVVRFRIDGVLHDVFEPPKTLQQEIVSRIKVMGKMNIAERRLAQDGRATVEVGERVVDLRIATLPTNLGERAVIRLLDKSLRTYELSELGMPKAMLQLYRQLIHTDHGIILVTGPTGSGKSTTLYASLAEINSRQRNILTLEDPIEYGLEGISQTQVSDKKGMTFASGLRHVLRQDPDIIMVGEIRDPQTARMAIQSALTGHLVLSTLHTNDAAGAITRMLDLGIEPYLLASSLLGSLAQRLVRRICPQCRSLREVKPSDLQRWNITAQELDAEQLYIGQGCGACMDTGYHERIGVFELLTVNEPVRELILHQAKASSIKVAAKASGMTTLRTDGISKALAGVSTMDEICRVAAREEF